MHRYDEFTERIARAVFEYTDERLRLDPVPLDHGFEPDDLDARAPSLIGRSGNDPEVVMQQFRDVLSPAVISCDSPRFLAFIPAAPTKASLLFDMVVSASSMSGISWLESAGAVHAENQALRFLADLAGLPGERRRLLRTGRFGCEPRPRSPSRVTARARRVSVTDTGSASR